MYFCKCKLAMFTTVLLFLPFLTCLYWLALNPLFHKKDKAYGSLELFLAMTCIGMLAEAGFACTEGNVILSFFFIRQFFALLIVPSAFDYNYRLIHSDGNNSFLLICISIPVSLLFAGIILLILSGTDGFIDCVRYPAAGQIDDVGRLIHFCSFWLFYGVLAIEVLLFAVYTLIMTLKGNRHLQIFNTTIFVLVFSVLELSVMLEYVFASWAPAVVSFILACVIFFTSYCGLFHGKKDLSAGDIVNGVVGVIFSESDCSVQESGKSDDRCDIINMPVQVKHRQSGSLIAEARQSQANEDYLRERFEDLIVSEQLFLRQGLKISDIASMLETNRTYVSRLVNNTYNMSFSDYINTLRIDYAEQYLLHHRDARLLDLAVACGFPNASAFNNVFKKITGFTPKTWLATNS